MGSIIKDYLALKLKTTSGVELKNWQEIAKRLGQPTVCG